ncbi:unnamed protein product [Polarella glacialis]|uniref:Uncharacterized protein n=1 Tax=Polarella glacialis TaxID=89957 RepID=A0A813E938_POLGL|nr:unnamed protein product [Polarella glacialis]
MCGRRIPRFPCSFSNSKLDQGLADHQAIVFEGNTIPVKRADYDFDDKPCGFVKLHYERDVWAPVLPGDLVSHPISPAGHSVPKEFAQQHVLGLRSFLAPHGLQVCLLSTGRPLVSTLSKTGMPEAFTDVVWMDSTLSRRANPELAAVEPFGLSPSAAVASMDLVSSPEPGKRQDGSSFNRETCKLSEMMLMSGLTAIVETRDQLL